jgi:glycosyltransferase involved in cell wall biosynthesis
VHVTFVYKTPLPSPTTASIQFVNTLRELCELGATCRIRVPRLEAAPEACLHHYGVTPHPRLRLERIPGFHHDGALAKRLREVQEAVPDGEPHFLVTRGEVGLRVFDALRALPRRRGERRLFEQHRLCWTAAAEACDPSRPARESWRDHPEVAAIRAREAAAVADADALVCNSQGTLDWLRELGGGERPALVVPAGSRPAREPALPDAARDLDLLYVGKLKARKGLVDLFGALARLPGVRLALAGGNTRDTRWARETAASAGVAERVDLLGYVAPVDLPGVLARARVGVCPLPTGAGTVADHFTNPVKLITMMGHHVPIVATRTGPVREVVEDGRTALLARPNDPDSLARAIRRLLDDRELARRLAAAARGDAERFTWACRARRLHDFLETLP